MNDLKRSKSENKLIITIILNLTISIFEIIGGILSGSLSLISDALHNLSDSASMFISLFSLRVANREKSSKNTYGFKRAEIIAALINSILLFITLVYIFYESIQRLIHPQEVSSIIMLPVAFIGLLGNFFSAVLLFKESQKSMNLKSTFLHIVIDTISSVIVIVGGLIIHYTGWFYIDPVLSLIVITYVLKEGYTIFREVVHILMQGTPADIDLSQIKSRLESIPGVENIHHIHVWSLNENERYSELHALINCQTLNEMDQLRDQINRVLRNEFQINHTTIQFEGEKCKITNI
ncbi:cation diffusion facilitator family transporter [Atribacter laminatus]|jgi:cobalt-zinc-cadmium efflux system protein|uniref:Cadmium, cobalt and zinc/H(+)-K(+) antiporter n=1 Tax=Atribacter laminatus TaxID=2847778 RepID=A0A7T1AKW7_ATRLM|nr:cation diffusion facilitator family transporter [Atribacter laminatus]QPM67807.1 Cadmium, cobalt and zinc/H(+)-K(+) antiporter [Atribacter laminatus]